MTSKIQGIRILFCGLMVLFIMTSWTKYFSLHSYYVDLGIFQTWLYGVVHRGEWERIFVGHAHLASLLYVGILKYIPVQYDAEALLLLQAIALLLPVLFLYRRFGIFITIVFTLYAPLWINNHFEFHFDHLVVPLLTWFFLAATSNRPFAATIAGLLLMTVKEPFALQTVACGVFLLSQGRNNHSSMKVINKPYKYIELGLLLIMVGLLYFYFATHYLIPYFSNAEQSAVKIEGYAWLGNSLSQMLKYIVLNPLRILLQIMTTPGKLLYLFVVFGSLAFIPLLAPRYLIPAIPLLGIALLSQDATYYSVHKHYTAGLIIPLLFAFAYGLPKARFLWNQVFMFFMQKLIIRRLNDQFSLNENKVGGNELVSFYGFIMLCVLVGHIFLAPSPISWWFWSDKLWAYNWRAYYTAPRDKALQRALLEIIPADPLVSVIVQASINTAHLAHREIYRPFPEGITTPIVLTDWSQKREKGFWQYVQTGNLPEFTHYIRYADYVILDLKRPWFVGDRSCRWHYGVCQDKKVAQEFLSWVAETRKQYHIVFAHDGFMIFQRT